MNAVIDQIIAFLYDLQGEPLLDQILTLAGIPSLLLGIIGYRIWRMSRKLRASVSGYEALED